MRASLEETIRRNLDRVRGRIEAACRRSGRDAGSVTLVAVIKYVEVPAVEALIQAGQQDIGESRVQDGQVRVPLGQGRVRWHLVGSLQTNKVGKALRLFDAIHSLDRWDLVEAIRRRAERPVRAFVQVDTTPTAGRRGVPAAQVREFVERLRREVGIIDVAGLMVIAPLGEDPRPHFRRVRELAERLGLAGLSMGMSEDFEAAIEEGATHVRVGSALAEGLPPAMRRERHAAAGR